MLTETAIKAAKGADKPYKLFDEKSLFLLVNPTGARLWRLKYRLHGKEKLLAIGSYPDITLKRAREKRDDARKLIADGIDPSVKKKSEKNAALDTFEVIAAEWFGQQRYKPKTSKKVEWLLRDWLNKYLGSRPIRTITAPDILAICRRLETRGKHESAHRVRGLASRVFRYAIATGRADRDPSQDLRGALAPIVVTNHAAITEPKKIGELLRAIDDYQGQPGTSAALKLAPLTFVRPGELRAAQWSEFELDGDAPQWRIPGERMKMGDQHLVPLSRQAVAILRDLHAATGYGKFLFPSLRSSLRCISDNTINAALRRLGYGKDEMVGHGFRSMASTCLNEQGWHPDLIELQLAHAERNKVRAAYNRAERLAERRKMMQAWADYLDGLKARGDKVALNDASEPAVAASNP
jgi:integrase